MRTNRICAICGKRKATYIYYANKLGITDYPIYVCGRCLKKEIEEGIIPVSDMLLSAPEKEVMKAIEMADQVDALIEENRRLMKEVSSLKKMLHTLINSAINPEEIAKRVASMITPMTRLPAVPPSLEETHSSSSLPLLPPPRREERANIPVKQGHRELVGELKKAFKKWKIKVEEVGGPQKTEQKSNIQQSEDKQEKSGNQDQTN